jgi:hypothetical protein
MQPHGKCKHTKLFRKGRKMEGKEKNIREYDPRDTKT